MPPVAGGYDFELVIAVTEFVCTICQLILRDAVVTPCNHRFCRVCISTWLRNREECPNDRRPLRQSEVQPDITIRQSILNADVHCSNQDCNEVLRLGDAEAERNCLKKHREVADGRKANTDTTLRPKSRTNIQHSNIGNLPQCKDRHGGQSRNGSRSSCPNGCSAILAAGDVERHVRNECPRRHSIRSRRCPYNCNALLLPGELSDHMRNSCELRRTICPQCRTQMRHRELADHSQNHCTQRRIPCQLCHVLVAAVDMNSHVRNCSQRHARTPSRLSGSGVGPIATLRRNWRKAVCAIVTAMIVLLSIILIAVLAKGGDGGGSEPCTEDTVCVEHASCDAERSGQCVCAAQFAFKANGECGYRAQSSCDADAPCVDHASCAGTWRSQCTCDPHFLPTMNGTCGLEVGIVGVYCGNSATCVDHATCDNDVTQQCVCDPHYLPKTDGTCGLKVSDECTSNAACVDHAICSSDQCVCAYHYSSRRDGSCGIQLGQNVRCNRDIDCVDNAECSSGNCVCSADYSPASSNTCGLRVGHMCTTLTTCVDQASCNATQYKAGVCQCQHGYSPVNGGADCGLKVGAQGIDCTSLTQLTCVENAVCDSATGQCRCQRAHGATSRGTCGNLVGSLCTADAECVDQAECLRNHCKCNMNSTTTPNNLCELKAEVDGVVCGSATVCVNNATCDVNNTKQCLCDKHYVRKESGYCGLKPGVLIRSRYDCNQVLCADNASCSQRYTGVVCLCSSSYPNITADGRCADLNAKEGDVRLVDGAVSSEGRVEVFLHGVWGTVCDNYRYNDDDGAEVVCRQLGLSSIGARLLTAGKFGQGQGPIILKNVDCSGTESRLVDCLQTSSNYYNDRCSHADDMSVSCNVDNGEVRLVDGSDSNEGRVEVFYNGAWGTVSDDDWDNNDAAVVCRQLGKNSNGARGLANAHFGRGVGYIRLTDVQCHGNESLLFNCHATLYNSHSRYGHSDDASVRCGGHSRAATTGVHQTTVISVCIGLVFHCLGLFIPSSLHGSKFFTN